MSFPRSPLAQLRVQALWILACLSCLSGCDASIATFQPNVLFVAKMEKNQVMSLRAAVQDSNEALAAFFGTPDNPQWPSFRQGEGDSTAIVEIESLQRAAGAVRSDEQDQHFGLYREHCVNCHGLSGDGLGPTSRFLNPYPRDFRLGKFKFKSTSSGSKPTRGDLKRVLTEGLMGTSMPSFRLLKDNELDALADYVIYLSVRGEVERRLLTEAAMELDYAAGDRLFDATLKDTEPESFNAQWKFISNAATSVVDQWLHANESLTQVPEPPAGFKFAGRQNELTAAEADQLAASVDSGRKLFQGPIANCASCHGATAVGDGQTKNYDAWTKDWMEGIDPQNQAELRPLLNLGALKPRFVLPRNLRRGVYRGGSEPRDLYLRIVNGIDGTPMPATPIKPANPQGLTADEVWDLVNFLLSLPHEEISKDAGFAVSFSNLN